MDKIHIRDILLRCIIGVNDDERREKQDVVINICLHADLRKAGRSDDFGDTVDYKAVKQRIIKLVEASKFFLVEALAEAIAQVCLEFNRVKVVDVRVEKPGALRFARTVGVEISRRRAKQLKRQGRVSDASADGSERPPNHHGNLMTDHG